MKKLLLLALLLLFVIGPVHAQAAHSVALAWTASSDAAANPSLTYNMYRLNGACPAVAPTAISGSGFTKINTAAITTTAYTDSTVAPGTYCYFGSAFLNLTESNPSNDASAVIQPKPMTSLGVTSVASLRLPSEILINAVLRKLAQRGMIEVQVPA